MKVEGENTDKDDNVFENEDRGDDEDEDNGVNLT